MNTFILLDPDFPENVRDPNGLEIGWRDFAELRDVAELLV
jgi:hypothetical protein